VLSQFSYTHYADGNRESEVQTDDTDTWRTTYTYDESNRLTREDRTRNGSADYDHGLTYDDVGNMTQKSDMDNGGARIAAYTYNALDQVTQATDAGGTTHTNFSYSCKCQVPEGRLLDGAVGLGLGLSVVDSRVSARRIGQRRGATRAPKRVTQRVWGRARRSALVRPPYPEVAYAVNPNSPTIRSAGNPTVPSG